MIGNLDGCRMRLPDQYKLFILSYQLCNDSGVQVVIMVSNKD